ncbi:Lamin Tail Domain [Streptomyces sp. 2231.1]|uniref:lamin tail domain-containing protein n=1 Tax=Streptomyces sp. 2231.1 TaxID=1855347 RepID=UPI00089512C2|nr:Lamin Tail Domain [Streptomyces sp. 2231.1]
MSVSVSVIARRVAAAAAAAAALVGAAALPASAADHDHGRSFGEHVVISDVQYRSPGRDDRSNLVLNREWVQLTNQDRRAVNLDGWTLSTENGRVYTFRDYRLDGRSTVRVHTGIGRDSGNDLYQDRRRDVLDDRSGTATLRNDRGRYVDSVSWGHDDRGHRGDDRWGHDDRGHRGDDRWGHDNRDHDRWGHDSRDHRGDNRDHRDGDRRGPGHDGRRHGGHR